MKGFFRYMAALLAVLCLLAAAVLGVFCCVTTEQFALEVNGTTGLQALQQAHINKAANDLTAQWQLSADLLTPWTAEAAVRQGRAVAAWWGALWTDPAADVTMPAWLDAASEAALVTALREDPGFISATAEDRRRAIARDDVAYALDEAVCRTVTPLRRSVVEMALGFVADVMPLPMMRQAMILGAAVLAGLALLLLLLAHKAAGSALMATGLVMAAVTAPAWLADVPGMLAQLGDVVVKQGGNALQCLMILWYGAAAVLFAAGLVIAVLKKLVRGDRE